MNQKIINNKRVVGNKKGSGRILISALLLLTIFTIAANDIAVNKVSAATSPPLGAWGTMAILANTLISSAGNNAVITGDVASTGLGTAIGLLCSEVSGSIFSVDASPVLPCVVHNSAVPTTAQTDWVTANNALGAQSCDITYAGVKDLVGLSLVAGVYCADAFTLTGTLTLSGSGVWVFKSAATLITSGTANVVGGDPCNVWWRLVSSATLGSSTQLIGSIFANVAIGLGTGATLNGRALAHTAAVTLDGTNTVNLNCPLVSLTTIVTSLNTTITTVVNNSTTTITTVVSSIISSITTTITTTVGIIPEYPWGVFLLIILMLPVYMLLKRGNQSSISKRRGQNRA